MQGCQPLAVRSEAGAAPAVARGGEALRLAACRGHLPQVHGSESVGRPVAVRAGSEHDGFAVGRPGGIHLFAAIAAAAPEARGSGQLRAGQQVARGRRGVHGLHINVRAARIQPAVPVADGEARVDPRVVLPRLVRFLGLLVVRVIQGARVRVADEQQLRAVRRKLWCTGTEHEAGHALRFAALREVEHVHLRHLVGIAFAAEREATTVGAPRQTAFAGTGIGQAARRLRAIGAYQPEVARLLVVIGRLADAERRPLAIGAGDGGTHSLQQPNVFVCRNAARVGGVGVVGGGGGRAGRRGQQAEGQGGEQDGAGR